MDNRCIGIPLRQVSDAKENPATRFAIATAIDCIKSFTISFNNYKKLLLKTENSSGQYLQRIKLK